MDSFTLKSSSGKFTRKAFYLPAISKARRIALFLDAEYYVDQMDTPALLLELQESRAIEPIACLFVSNHDAEARHHDYTCSDPYADFLAKDLIPWMSAHAGIPSRGGHLLTGLSLSGLQAVYTALSYPHVFPQVLSQSPSMWWENEWLTRHLREFDPSPCRFWLSVGTKEKGAGLIHPPTDLHQQMDQDAAIHHASEALKQQGHRVHDHLFEGGHETRCWQQELPSALTWLLSKPSTA